MPDKDPPNRSDEYRRRAAEARAKAEKLTDKGARHSMLEVADTWERMAEWEDKTKSLRPVPDSD